MDLLDTSCDPVSCGAEYSAVKGAVNIMGILDTRTEWAGVETSGDVREE
jgi:hypothetical protein